MNKYSIKDIKKILGSDVIVKGDFSDKYFDKVKPIQEADSGSLVWIDSRKKDKEELITKTKSKVIICDDNINIYKLVNKKCFIIVKNPKLAFINVADKLFSKSIEYSIHPTAFISKNAKIHKDVYIGPFVYVGNSEVKKGTIIYGNCFIYDNVLIDENVIIHAGCIIGADGFGYERNEKNEFEKFPHFGGVVIEKNVEIGANTCIDRGTLGNTIIKEGVKIDNLVHIAHNVVVGKHSAVIANSMVGGSTYIGDYSWIAPSVSLMNKIKINNDVTIGLGAVVTKDIPQGETWTGSPARPLPEFLEILKKLKNL